MNLPRINVPPAAALALVDALGVDGGGGDDGHGDGGGASCACAADRSPPPPVSCELYTWIVIAVQYR